MAVEVRFRQAALTDLFDLYAYIAEQSGRARASTYIDRIETACMALADSPERGTRRDDLRPGLRTLGFQRQASIVFRIDGDGVEIGRILYGGRNLDALAIDPEDESAQGALMLPQQHSSMLLWQCGRPLRAAPYSPPATDSRNPPKKVVSACR